VSPLCSGATHIRTTFYLGCSVTFLLSLPLTNHALLTVISAVRKLTTLHDCRRAKSTPKEPKRDPSKDTEDAAKSNDSDRGERQEVLKTPHQWHSNQSAL
jgi:hypothetical protein